MEPWVVGILGILALFVLLSLSVNLGVALLGVGALGSAAIVGWDAAGVQAVTTTFVQGTNATLVIIPLFTLMGLLAAAGGIAANLFTALNMWTGRFRAGIGVATVVSNAAFGTVCGTGLVSAAVFGRIAAPQMRRLGYHKRLAYGITASAGSIGMLIPPSLYMVIWAMLTQQSAGKLLIAGIGPGLLLTVTFSLVIWIISVVRPSWVGSPPTEKYTWKQRIFALRLFWPIIVVATVLIGGIMFGVFNPTEAAAVAVVVMIFLTMIIARKTWWQNIKDSIGETVTVSAMVFLVICGALMLSRFFAVTGMTNGALGFIINLKLDTWGFMLVMIVVYLILGCFITGLAMMAITLPVIFPVVTAMHIDPIWFAMVMIVAIEAGGITPPVGTLCFVTKGVAEPDVTLEDVFMGIMPFLAMWVISLIILMIFPWISTVFVKLMM